MARVLSCGLLSLSVVCAPVTVIAGHQSTGDKQNQVHKPPDSQASQGEQLPNRSPCVAQAETINPETAQEEGIQQCGDEVVSSVFDARYILSEELSGSGTFYVIECSAENPCVVHLFLGLATPPDATNMFHLLIGSVVACVIHRVLTVDELLR